MAMLCNKLAVLQLARFISPGQRVEDWGIKGNGKLAAGKGEETLCACRKCLGS